MTVTVELILLPTIFQRRLKVLDIKISVSQWVFFSCPCGDLNHLFLECNSHNEVKNHVFPVSFLFHSELLSCLRVYLSLHTELSEHVLDEAAAWLALVPCPESCLILIPWKDE